MNNMQHTYLDKLGKELADSIDTHILYEAMGWTIVKIPFPWHFPTLFRFEVTDWLTENNIKDYRYWDKTYIAFKEGKDATFFILRWI
jgi:hypothetical protein